MAKSKKFQSVNRPRRSPQNNIHTTRKGNTVKLNQSLGGRLKARRDARALRKAEMLRDMPKGRLKRILYRLHPKRLYRYWFSREGLIMALKLTGVGIVAVFVLIMGLFAYFRKDLPDLRDISGNNIGGSIRYYDRTGQTLLWEDYDAVKRIPVEGENISQFMKDATVAVEDRAFYEHSGFNLKGIMRAGIANLSGGSTTQGGSTITQQLVKLTQDWTKDRSYTRKIKELILSVELERTYSKSEILTGYLNAAPYGNIEYGVEAAARDYFQKSAKELTLDEASFLAVIPKSPSYYSPYGPLFNDGGREDVIMRQHYTLDIMQELGKITNEQRDEAKKIDILSKVKSQPPKYGAISAPYFVLAAKEQLEDKLNDEEIYKRGGWKVTTTLDLGLQKIAEDQVQKGLVAIRRQGGDAAAFTAEDVETGQIVALVGGPDFTNPTFGQNNYARLPLPPGSSIKPYDYVALIENTTNFGAGTVLFDTQGELPGYPCTSKGLPPPKGTGNCLHDYDFKYPGPVTVRYALGGSRNIPAVKAMLITGVDKTIEMINKLTNTGDKNSFGYKCYKPGTTAYIKDNEDQCYGSSAIGDGAFLKQDEHVHGFATISRNGIEIPRTYILKIEADRNKVLDEWKPKTGTQVVRADSAYIVADIMEDPNASYMSRKAHRFNGSQGTWKFAIKTGTTNDAKDGWMMGFSTKYAASVWVGYHDRTKAMSGFMETMTQPIWQGWMQEAHKDLKPKDRPKPSTIQTLPAYIIRSHVGNSSVEPSPTTDLYPSWYQNKNTATNKKQTIDIISNKLATECTPNLAKKELDTSSASSFSGDTFVTGQANTEEKDDVHQCTDARPEVNINTSATGGGAYTLTATITRQGTHPLTGNGDKGGGKVNILVDGQINKSFDISPGQMVYETTYTPDSGSKSVSAQVIDSVLYDATSGTMTVTAATPIANFEIEATRQGPNVKIKWDDGVGGAVSYCVSLNASATCLPITEGGTVPHGGATSGIATVYAKNATATTITSASDSY